MVAPAVAAKEFVSGPRVIQAARQLLEAFSLQQLCEALVTAQAENAETLVLALEGLTEFEEVRPLFLGKELRLFLSEGATAPDPRVRSMVAKLVCRLATHDEESVAKVLDAKLLDLCEPLLLDEDTGVAEAAARAVCAAAKHPAGQQAIIGGGPACGQSLSEALQSRLKELNDVQRIRILALFVDLGRASAEAFAALEARKAFDQVLQSFLTDDLLLKLNAVELMDALGSYERGQDFLARANVPDKLAQDLADPCCDPSVRLCVTRLLGFIAGRSRTSAEILFSSHEAPFPQSIAGMLDSRDVSERLCAINAWATASLQQTGLVFFLRWKPLLQEMVSLVSATQNEVAKGAMDAWATILQDRTPDSEKEGADREIWTVAEQVTPAALKNLSVKPFPDVRPHTWRLLSILTRSRSAAQQALQSQEVQELLLNFQSENSSDARYAKHDVVKTLLKWHSNWLSGLLDTEVFELMSQFAQQGPYWIPQAAGTAMKDQAA
mmetsp:Transcript_19750/g.37148  ORF Transcript_19750/g.37148 Transcript_19750/m.37148 type:complete len:495 (+) Transcript_19750:26-1510(+)